MKKKTLKKLEEIKTSPKPHENPLVPYKRTVFLVKKSRFTWMFELIRLGHGKVVAQYLLIWATVIATIALLILFIVKLIWGIPHGI